MTSIDPKLRTALTGISGILVTPFDERTTPAPGRLTPIVDRAIDAGVHILVANGNTGEFYGLTTAEAERMVHAAPNSSAGACPCSAASDAACPMPARSRAPPAPQAPPR